MSEPEREDHRLHLVRLSKLLSVSHKLHSTLDLEKALEIVLDTALEMTGMKRGFIMLYSPEHELEFRLGRDGSGQSLTSDEFRVSQTAIRMATSQQKLITFGTPTTSLTQSMVDLRIQCGFCVPLFAYRWGPTDSNRKRIIGVLYEDSREPTFFGDLERQIVDALALHAGLALENAYLFEMATLDGLTRVFGRHFLGTAVEKEWRRAVRHGHSLSILMSDVDHFKKLNDASGHDVGDHALRRIAQCMKTICRAEDIIGRYGGDEFVILLPETKVDGAQLVAQRIMEAVAAGLELPEPVTISIGIASYPPSSAESGKELMQRADKALYRAKQEGRNRICVYEEPQ